MTRAPSANAIAIERARRLLSDAEQALDDVQRQVQGLAGRVRLGASTGAIAHLLPQALEVLGQRHSGIDVQVVVLTSQETLVRLAAGARGLSGSGVRICDSIESRTRPRPAVTPAECPISTPST